MVPVSRSKIAENEDVALLRPTNWMYRRLTFLRYTETVTGKSMLGRAVYAVRATKCRSFRFDSVSCVTVVDPSGAVAVMLAEVAPMSV